MLTLVHLGQICVSAPPFIMNIRFFYENYAQNDLFI